MTLDPTTGLVLDPDHEAAVDAQIADIEHARDEAKLAHLSREFIKASDKVVTLYALADEWKYLIWLLDDPQSDSEAIEQELHRVAGDIRTKGYGLAVVLQGLDKLAERQEFESNQHKAEVDRLAAKAKRTRAEAQRVKEYAMKCMDEIGERRIETGVFTLSVRLNNPKVDVVDEAAIPAEYWRQPLPPPEIDKTKILEHWRATGGKSTPDGVVPGESVPGVSVVRGKRLAFQ